MAQAFFFFSMKRQCLANLGLLPVLITIILNYARGFKRKQTGCVQCDQEIVFMHVHENHVFLLLEDGSVWKMCIGDASAWNNKICILPAYRNGSIDVGDGGGWVIVDETGEHLWAHRTEHHLDGGPITYVSLVNGKSFDLDRNHYSTYNPYTIADGLVFRGIGNRVCYYAKYDALCECLAFPIKTLTVFKNHILWIDCSENMWMFDGKETSIIQKNIMAMIRDKWTIWVKLKNDEWIDWNNKICVSSIKCPKSITNGDFLIKNQDGAWIRNTNSKLYPQGLKNILLLPSGELFGTSFFLRNDIFFCDDKIFRIDTGRVDADLNFLGLAMSETQKSTFILLCYNHTLISFK